jgi:methylmalonyl-CoA epimerase
MKKINHLGIAVKNLERASALWEKVLGLKKVGEEYVPDQNVKVAIFQIGESRVELLEPLKPDSPMGKFLDKRGEGIHHVCLEVDNLESALLELKTKDAPLIDESPRTGAGGHKIAFLHPKGFNSVLIELLEE